MIAELRIYVQLAVFIGLCLGPMFLYARWRDANRDWPQTWPEKAVVVGTYLALVGGGLGAALLAIPNAGRLFP